MTAPEKIFSSCTPCTHCGTDVPPALTTPHATEQFCCAGCRAAWHLLRSCDLTEFHRLRSGAGLPAMQADGSVYNSIGFTQAHVRQRSDGLSVIEWYVIGMHCPACVWLLERLPRLDAGIISSRVHFGLGRLSVVFDPQKTTPGAQAALTAQLGYRLKPWHDQGSVTAEKRDLFLRFAVSAAAAIGAMHLSLNLYAGELSRDLGAADSRLFAWLALAVAMPAITWGSAPLWRAALTGIRHKRFGIDALATLVIIIGTLASLGNILSGSRELYVDALAMFIALLLLGRVVLLSARERVAAASGGLDHLLPTMATRRDGVAVPVTALIPGDIIRLHANDILPADGIVIDTAAIINQAILTGESRPMTLAAGATAYAGSTCHSADMLLSITATGSATRIGTIIAQLSATAERPQRLSPLIDRIAKWFAPLLVIIAVAVFCGWWFLGNNPAQGINQAIALILVSCPCALGLATPLVHAFTIARAAQRGILIRDPVVLEVLSSRQLKHMVFDKTGTLTTGALRVIDWQWLVEMSPQEQQRIRSAVASIEDRSQHPIALALSSYLADAPRIHLDEWHEIPAQGVSGVIGTASIRIGWQAANAHSHEISQPPSNTPWVLITHNEKNIARVTFEDPIRPHITQFLQTLRNQDIRLSIASGDDQAVTTSVGTALGFSPQDAHGRLSPEGKAAFIQHLSDTGPVAMIGDGLNDAAAMTHADAAIGISGGLEAALGSCHVFIVHRQADHALHDLWATAHASRRRINLILGVSLAYNVVGVALAAGGIWGPYICAVAMPLSSLTAIFLALAPIPPHKTKPSKPSLT